MKSFFIKLITAGSGLSSKRFISLLGMVLFIGVVICSLFGITPPDLIVYSLVTIIVGGQGLSLINTSKN